MKRISKLSKLGCSQSTIETLLKNPKCMFLGDDLLLEVATMIIIRLSQFLKAILMILRSILVLITTMQENLIKQDFHADEPLKKILTDITEVPCMDGKLYVSPIMDCFNGEIVALEMRDNMNKELCVDTLQQLKSGYGKRLSGAILHSDRGSQYTSGTFREELRNMGMIQSLSGVHHCYDNARMESFFGTLKKEKLYRIPTHRMTRDEVRTIIFRYVFGYYNTIRVTSFNPEGLPPVAYREMYLSMGIAA